MAVIASFRIKFRFIGKPQSILFIIISPHYCGFTFFLIAKRDGIPTTTQSFFGAPLFTQ